MQHLYQLEREGDKQNITSRTGQAAAHCCCFISKRAWEPSLRRSSAPRKVGTTTSYSSTSVKYFATSSHPVLLETMWFAILTTYEANHCHTDRAELLEHGTVS